MKDSLMEMPASSARSPKDVAFVNCQSCWSGIFGAPDVKKKKTTSNGLISSLT